MKKTLKTLVVALISVVILTTLLGFSQTSMKARTAKTAARTNISIAVNGDIGDMSIFGGSPSASYVKNQIYESLYTFGYNMKETPLLATSWDKVSVTHYTFHLRHGVKFQDGNSFTAKDVLFSMKLYAADANLSQYVSKVDFKKTKVTDDYTIDIFFTEQNAFAFSQLAGIIIVNENSWKASKDKMVTDPVGTGPYMLKDYVSGSYCTLKAFAGYWGSAPSIKEAKFTIISEASQRTTALETNEVQLVMDLQSSDVNYIRGKNNYTVLDHKGIISKSLFFNMSNNSLFKSKQARQALCYAINNSSINKVVYGGLAKPSVSYISTAMKDYTSDMSSKIYTTTDLNKAKSLMKAAGITNGSVKIATDGSSEDNATAEILQSTLQQLGITAEIKNYDGATIWSVASDPKQWDLLLMLTAAPSGYGLDDMQAFMTGLNFSKWKGTSYETFAKLCKDAVATANDKVRLALTKKAIAIVQDECPIYSMVQKVDFIAYDKDINFKVWDQASIYLKDLK